MHLLHFVGDGTIHRDLRQAACIVLKNNIKDYWTKSVVEIDPAISLPYLHIGLEDREVFKVTVLNYLLPETENSIRGMFAEIIKSISESDFPDLWPAFLPTILASINSTDVLKVYNALLALRKVVKRYEFKADKDKGPLNHIIVTVFPVLQQLMKHIISMNSLEVAQVLRLCLKIFWSATMYSLPRTEGVDVGHWFSCLAQLIEKKLPEASEGAEPTGQPTSPDERRVWPWWKLKKWAHRIVQNFIQRYGNPKYATEEDQQFAVYFRSNTAVQLLGPILSTLAHKAAGHFVTEDVTRGCITYLGNAVEMSPTFKAMQPHIDFILFQVVFEALCISPQEITLFTDDPTEFIRKVYDPLQEWLDPRLAAVTLLQNLARYRQKYILAKFLSFVQSKLEQYGAAPVAQRNYREKDGILVAIASLEMILRESKVYAAQVPAFLRLHVVPEFQSPVAFVRARAFWTIDMLDSSEFTEPAVLEVVLQGLLSGLRDPALPVQNAAACAMSKVIAADGSEDMLRPILPALVGEYFRIIDDAENESLLSSLQIIIEKFGPEIVPMAPQIVERMIDGFNRLTSAGNDDDEAAFAANDTLNTILVLLEAIQDDQACLAAVEAALIPLVQRLLTDGDQCFEYLEGGVTMLTHLTYYPPVISPAVWSCCGPLLVALDEWACDFLDTIMTPLLNYMTKDIATFITGQHDGAPLTMKLLVCVEKAFVQDDSERERDAKMAATLLTCFVECVRANLPAESRSSCIDQLVPQIVRICVARLTISKTDGLPVRVLEVLMALIYYNSALTLQSLEELGASTNVFDLLFGLLQSMERDSTERLIVLSFSTILANPLAALPAVVQRNVPTMFQQVIREVILIEKEAALPQKEDDDEEEEDDEDDDEDDMFGGGGGGAQIPVPSGGWDEEDDCANAEDEAYLKSLGDMEKKDVGKAIKYIGGEPVDDEDDDYSYTAPSETTDVLAFFVLAMRAANAAAPALVAQLQGSLPAEDTQRLQQIFELSTLTPAERIPIMAAATAAEEAAGGGAQ